MNKENLGLVLENSGRKSYYVKNDIPYKPFGDEDLSEIIIAVKETVSDYKWKYVTYKDLAEAGLTFNEAYDAAYNADEKRGFTMETLSDYLSGSPIPGGKKAEKYKKLADEGENIQVLTNDSGIHGAGVLLHKGFLEKVIYRLEENGRKDEDEITHIFRQINEPETVPKRRCLMIYPVSSHRLLCTLPNVSPSVKKCLESLLSKSDSPTGDPVLAGSPIVFTFDSQN